MRAMFECLIGSCGVDNQGLEGLELYFNDYLVGKSGFVVYQKDPTGEIFPYYNYPEKKPEPGSDIFLTIDLQMQTILYTNLKAYMAEEEALGAAGLIVQPHTGEILALVNIRQDGSPRNTVICDEFEPGSTFKLATLTYALLKGAKENDMINTDGGKIEINGHRINDFKNYGVVSLRQAIAHSSNVAMVKTAREFNRRDFFMLIQDFGFTQPTGLEFPGEIKGRLADPESMRDIEYATLAFGQGVTCNLLQLAFAYQAIANGGVLQKPLIVREIKQDKQIRYRSRPLRVRRVVDDDIAQRVTSILCSVVDEGSGVEAQIDGLKIAGKTGTAQKVIGGVYSNTQIITTFVGYFPADEPEYLIAVMLDEPKKGLWASTIAAPIFKRVAQSLCQMNGVDYAAR
jgi:cell division protein FtsI/penicillin-binding protein 2